jgi:aspartate-semialdehyde dehydrogenase
VNPHRVADYRKRGIIANPNCSTIQMVVALKPLHDAVGVRRVIVSTYQSVSGAGRRALEELNDETASALRKAPYERKIFPKPIAFNVIPQIGDFGEDGVSTEERKMMQETVKIMETDVVVDACCVRAPVRLGHSEAVWIETAKPITPEEARRILNAAPGVRVIDDPARGAYPTAAELDCEDDVLVGRVRRSGNFPNGLSFWIVSDNLRKGAAQNAVQIAEHLVRLWEREGRAAPASISGG